MISQDKSAALLLVAPGEEVLRCASFAELSMKRLFSFLFLYSSVVDITTGQEVLQSPVDIGGSCIKTAFCISSLSVCFV